MLYHSELEEHKTLSQAANAKSIIDFILNKINVIINHRNNMCLLKKKNLWHIDTGLLRQEAGSIWGQASAGSLTVNSYCDLSVSQNWSQLSWQPWIC